MIGTAACYNMDALDRTDLLVTHAELLDHDLSILDTRAECIAHRLGLLIHLLEHKMLVATFFCCIDIPLDRPARLFNRFAIDVIKLNIILCQTCDLLVLDKVDITRIFEDRRHIGCDQITVCGLAYNEWCILAQCIDMIGVFCKDDSERIGAFHTVHHLCDRIDNVAICLFIIVV